MIKLVYLTVVGLCFFCCELSAKQPNIIFILTDDQGYGDVECHGHPYLKTPNLNKLSKQSTRLTDYHVSPTCAPTRSALMTGLAPFKNGITHTILERERMALSSTTIAQVLKKANYTTGIFGKWHLGDEDPYQPRNRGFDKEFIHGGGGIGQAFDGSCADAPPNRELRYFDPVIRDNGFFVKTKGFCTDVFFKEALGWIKEKRDQPFFAYIATNAPHGPFLCPPEYKAMYADKTIVKGQAEFYGMITNIDDNLGVLMQKLDEWEMADDTLLIYMTDNGSAKGDYNAGMKGKKGSNNEGGAKVPAFFRWPGNFKADMDIDRLTRHIDIFPTLAAIAGESVPKLDGRNLLPLFKNPNAKWEDRMTFFNKGRWSKPGIEGRFGGNGKPEDSKYKDMAVRNETYRLVTPDQLYNIKKDPAEANNIISEHPEVAKKMLESYNSWWEVVRPCMINDDVPLAKEKPFFVAYEKQLEKGEISEWKEPKL